MNIPFKWTKQCQKSLDYVNQIITTSPILAYLDPNKQQYHFTDSSKHSWSGICIPYNEQTKDEVLHPITYHSCTFQGSKKNCSTLTNDAYAIYMSFCKMVYHLKDTQVMIRCEHAPLHKLYTQL